ncbi:LysM domain-containing protein [Bacillus sp. AFS017274]|uniref:LysM peptidoglycan-binding domain-containing protein n=1 Tax=Bacillus sp. AFS017274 TaxID=2033488 RepID=UPI000BF47758|nr:LysM domain-containing protein [Bacillus sp. AFS017274]PEZ76441.1 hypothetical protein CN380_21905 [Bacillus sp. AFS017274]
MFIYSKNNERNIGLLFDGHTEKLVNLIETSDLTKYDASNEEVYHIVKKGDSVSALAKAYGSTQVQIQKWNDLVDLNLIKVNQRLRVK